MKSLKALEDKYTLIREAVTPPAAPAPVAPAAAPAPAATTATPATSAAPAATTATPATSAAPAATTATPAAPAAQPSILTPEELKNATAAGILPSASKINAIAKDPQQLNAFSQNELPGIINGLLASIAKTYPEALKELGDAVKTNDINKAKSVLAKYAKLASAAPVAAPVTNVQATPPPVTGESIKLNEDGIMNKISGVASKALDTVQNKVEDLASKSDKIPQISSAADTIANTAITVAPYIALGVIGAFFDGAWSAAVAPAAWYVAKKIISSDTFSNRNNAFITRNVGNNNKWAELKNEFINASPSKITRKIGLGAISDLATYFDIKLTSSEAKKIKDGVALNLKSPVEDNKEPQFQITGGKTSAYVATITRDGNIWEGLLKKSAMPKSAARRKKPAAADPAAVAAAKAKADEEEKMLSASYTPFTFLANKVLKEFHKNSKPLPIETANKK